MPQKGKTKGIFMYFRGTKELRERLDKLCAKRGEKLLIELNRSEMVRLLIEEDCKREGVR